MPALTALREELNVLRDDDDDDADGCLVIAESLAPDVADSQMATERDNFFKLTPKQQR